jgi:hypothetical protein
VPGLLVRRLHEGLRHFSRCVSTTLFDGRKEGFGLRWLRAFLSFLLATAVDCFELGRCVDMMELRSKLHKTVQTSEV